MSYNPSVPLARLYECTSRKGNRYLRGRLGFANVVILETTDKSDSGQTIWKMLVSEPEPRSETDTDRPDRFKQAPSSEGQAAAARDFQRDDLNDPLPF